MVSQENHGWIASVDRDPSWLGWTLVLARRVSEWGREWQVVVGFTESGDAILATSTETDPVMPLKIRLPHGALRAIAEEVKPGPPSDAVGRLEEALKVERARVDQVLDRMWRNP